MKNLYILSSNKNLGQPIKMRFQESEERPKLFDELGKQIQQYMKVICCINQRWLLTGCYYFQSKHKKLPAILLLLLRNQMRRVNIEEKDTKASSFAPSIYKFPENANIVLENVKGSS